MERMLDLFKEPVEVQDPPEAKSLVMSGGEVIFGMKLICLICSHTMCLFAHRHLSLFSCLCHARKRLLWLQPTEPELKVSVLQNPSRKEAGVSGTLRRWKVHDPTSTFSFLRPYAG